MIRVTTGSRLHFGLLRVQGNDGERRFGGCGMMIQSPSLSVAVEPAAEWSASGPAADRALDAAHRVARAIDASPYRIVVESCPPLHHGMGVGTQVALAVGRAMTRSLGLPHISALELARWTGRGQRSAIGIHGFERGGFIVDGGQRDAWTIAPLVARAEFPLDWRVVLLLPRVPACWHGEREGDAFAKLNPTETDESLSRLVLLGLLPSLAERDLAAFSEALYEYNFRAGAPFQKAQGGTYAAAAVAGLVTWLRAEGISGVGQSSWGPTVFAVTGDTDRAAAITARARRQWADLSVVVATAQSAGLQ